MNEGKLFTESIDFIFGLPTNINTSEPPLIVCSTSAKLKSSTTKSNRLGKQFYPQEFNTYNSLEYYNNNTATVFGRPLKLLYHENWLDSLHRGPIDPVAMSSTYPSRTGLNITGNGSLKTWATHVLRFYGYGTEYWWHSDQLHSATGAETIVGGSFPNALLRIEQSLSQYSHDNITQLTPEMMPEPVENYTAYVYSPVLLYRELYGFRLASHTEACSATVLIMHAVVVLLGSLWHSWKGCIIGGWGTVPDTRYWERERGEENRKYVCQDG